MRTTKPTFSEDEEDDEDDDLKNNLSDDDNNDIENIKPLNVTKMQNYLPDTDSDPEYLDSLTSKMNQGFTFNLFFI